MIRLYQGDNKDGLADYDRALQCDPADAYSWNNRGQARMRLGDKQGAIADFRKALDINRACAPPAMACSSSALHHRPACRQPAFMRKILPVASCGRSRHAYVLEQTYAPMRPDLVRYRNVFDRGPLTYASFSREVTYVGLSFLQYAPSVGRLVWHAAWRGDRGVAMVSVPVQSRDHGC
jgi:tetratricopeptide (TPR) repeat protein